MICYIVPVIIQTKAGRRFMKILTGRKCILALFLMLLLPSLAYPIHISFYIGNVTALRQGKKINISMGTTMEAGDIVRTGRGGTVTLVYKDGSKITVKEKSMIKIGSKNIPGSDSVTLIAGNLSGKFSRLKKGRKKIYTPTTICAIRGTEFDIGVSKNGNSRVELKEGKLDVNNPYGSQKIKEGTTLETEISRKPRRVRSSSTMDSWRSKSDTDFEKNPKKTSRGYQRQINTFKNRNSKSGKETQEIGSLVKSARKKQDVVRAGDNLSRTEESIEDDLLMNEASKVTIETIMKDYISRTDTIFKTFERLKKECNKVAEQQRKNYEAIQAVKEAHRKAYERIIGRFQKDRDAILNPRRDNIRPKFPDKE